MCLPEFFNAASYSLLRPLHKILNPGREAPRKLSSPNSLSNRQETRDPARCRDLPKVTQSQGLGLDFLMLRPEHCPLFI